MMDDGAAATGRLGHDDLNPVAGQQPDGGGVDRRGDHALGAAGQQRDAGATRADGRIDAPVGLATWQTRRRQRQHCPKPPRQEPAQRTGETRRPHGRTEARRIGQQLRQQQP